MRDGVDRNYAEHLEALQLAQHGLISRRELLERMGVRDVDEELRRIEAEQNPVIKRRDNRWLVTAGIFILSEHRWKWQAALALTRMKHQA